MRSLVLAFLLVACADPNRNELTPDEKQRLGLRPEPAHARGRGPASRVVTHAPKDPVEGPVDCDASRDARVREAKETIASWNDKLRKSVPIVTWARAHKCRRIEDELLCDTASRPNGVTDAMILELADLDVSTSVDDVMFATLPECDAKEKPSLRVTYGDRAGQNAILSLP